MKDYTIFTDAAADIPDTLIHAHEIEIIPMTLTLNGQECCINGFHSNSEDHAYYETLRQADTTVSTSLISPESYVKYFSSALEKGKDVLYCCFSSGLSGTYQSAKIASEILLETYPESKVACVDTKGATIGQGMLTVTAAINKFCGMHLDENIHFLEDYILCNNHWFSVENLDYLKRGGRISAFSAAMGNALHIKPILYINDSNFPHR